MYESFYGLKEKPFSMLPDPGFLYLSRKHQMALTLLEYGLLNDAGFCVVSGETGSGKTTLLRKLLENIEDNFTVGMITNTHKGFGELLDWVLSAYGIHEQGLSSVEMHQKFMDFVVEQYAAGKTTLLVVDEAQNMTTEKLEELRMLSNVNSEKDQVLQVILAGQPELKSNLRTPELRQFAQRIGVDHHLGSLDAEETRGYINHRLSVAGAEREIFTDEACDRIYEYSGGTPRLINLLCDTVMVYGFADQCEVIDEDLVDEMVLERMQDSIVPLASVIPAKKRKEAKEKKRASEKEVPEKAVSEKAVPVKEVAAREAVIKEVPTEDIVSEEEPISEVQAEADTVKELASESEPTKEAKAEVDIVKDVEVEDDSIKETQAKADFVEDDVAEEEPEKESPESESQQQDETIDATEHDSSDTYAFITAMEEAQKKEQRKSEENKKDEPDETIEQVASGAVIFDENVKQPEEEKGELEVERRRSTDRRQSWEDDVRRRGPNSIQVLEHEIINETRNWKWIAAAAALVAVSVIIFVIGTYDWDRVVGNKLDSNKSAQAVQEVPDKITRELEEAEKFRKELARKQEEDRARMKALEEQAALLQRERDEALAKAKAEEEMRAREEARARAAAASERQAQEAARRKAVADALEAERKAQLLVKLRAEEAARLEQKIQQQRELLKAEEARIKAEEEARAKTEAVAKVKAEKKEESFKTDPCSSSTARFLSTCR
jgi:type II secretory pathway predicted ATPase ExeA